jgi:hypothetical protein
MQAFRVFSSRHWLSSGGEAAEVGSCGDCPGIPRPEFPGIPREDWCVSLQGFGFRRFFPLNTRSVRIASGLGGERDQGSIGSAPYGYGSGSILRDF